MRYLGRPPNNWLIKINFWEEKNKECHNFMNEEYFIFIVISFINNCRNDIREPENYFIVYLYSYPNFCFNS